MNRRKQTMKNSAPLNPFTAINLDELLRENNPLTIIQRGNRMFIAGNILEQLNKKGWNLHQFALRVGKDLNETRKLLNGELNFTIDTLAEIALVLEISVSDLVQVRHSL